MATNFFGKCTGKASSKYDIWLRVVENSQNIVSNTSNVTVGLYIKRNDGVDDSAYNLNASQNTVKLWVGGALKVNGNTAVDTRNNDICRLATWTGDVPHGVDGTLSLSVAGRFAMSGSASLTGGSASGSFKCSVIPRKSALSLSYESVVPGASVVATISAYSSTFSHKLKFSLGSESKTLVLDNTQRSVTFTVPLEWALQLATVQNDNIAITLTTYNGSTAIGSRGYSLTLAIPNNDIFKPNFDFTVERIDNNVPVEWGAYVQGESQVRISINNISWGYGATKRACGITVGGNVLIGEEGVFNLPKSGQIPISVTLKDSRGLKRTKTSTILVQPYAPPSVNIISVKRCTADGVPSVYGTSVLVEYGLKYSSVNGKNFCTASAKCKAETAAGYGDNVALLSSPCVVFADGINISNTYKFAFDVSDGINDLKEQVVRYVSSSNIPFNIRKGGNGAAFGSFAEKENELYVGWDLNVKGLIKGELYCTALDCTLSENAKDLIGGIRLYPCLNAVFVDIRITVAKALTANTRYPILSVGSVQSEHTTPLGILVNSDDSAFCKGAIYSTNNTISLSCNKNIPTGRVIYINGFYRIRSD